MRTVAEVMSTDVATVTTTDLVAAVRDLMERTGGHGVPVVDAGGTLVGLVTSSDLSPGADDDAGVATVMAAHVRTIGPGTTISEAARDLLEARTHHLVVIDNTRIVGVVSSFDLLRALVDEVPSLPGATEPQDHVPGGRARARVGDHVVIRSHTVGHERRGRITEVRGADGGPPYLVQWADDPHDEPHEVLFFPGPDADVESAED